MVSISSLNAQKVMKFETVSFNGLTYISKYEIIKLMKQKQVKGGVIIDVGDLKKKLDKHKMIEKYKLYEQNNKLLIAIREKKPVFLLGVIHNDDVTIYELDRSMKAISRNNVHATELPIIYIKKHVLKKRSLKEIIKKLYSIQLKIKNTVPRIFKELSLVYVNNVSTGNDSILRIMLRQRKTLYILNNIKNSLLSLKTITGYFDKIQYYPAYVRIDDDKVIIR